jgi:hypothetical protein
LSEDAASGFGRASGASTSTSRRSKASRIRGIPRTHHDAEVAEELVNDELDRRFFRDRYDAEKIYMAAMADLGDGRHSSAEIATHMRLRHKEVSVRRSSSLIEKGLIYNPIATGAAGPECSRIHSAGAPLGEPDLVPPRCEMTLTLGQPPGTYNGTPLEDILRVIIKAGGQNDHGTS